jgi:hypothetical protein
MKRPPLDDLIAALAPVVRPVMVRYFASNCCVATCSLLRRVFERYGYVAEPVPVSVFVFNARMVEALKNDEVPERGAPGRDLWFKITGAHGIGIMPESAMISALKGYDGFGGHLVLRVRDLLVDASIAQASRPALQINLPPLVATEATEEFMRGAALPVNVGGCCVQYHRLNNYSFRTAPDWRERSRFVLPLRDVLSQLQGVKCLHP